MEPNPITDQMRALIDEAARKAVKDKMGPLVERICEYIRAWGLTPPRPGGTRDRLAAEIAMRFGVQGGCDGSPQESTVRNL